MRTPFPKFRISYTAVLLLCCLQFHFSTAQPYAPPVGQAGTSAMYMDSSAFIAWATNCTVTRGYQDLSDPSLGFASAGDNTMATGKAGGNGVVSLGDGGSAVCTFAAPLKNGAGYDFAVFENGFDDLFLELAFVEVSSDGVNFFRFPAHSLTSATLQTGSFGATDATKINNLAGKYRGGYGTPFDLQELAGKPGLDINAITHIKLIDVVGSIDPQYGTKDQQNNFVNDPWPTAFPSGGFDLDAIGVIHSLGSVSLKEWEQSVAYKVYPNPVMNGDVIKITAGADLNYAELLDLDGKSIYTSKEPFIPTEGLAPGLYVLKLVSGKGIDIQKILVK